MPTDDLEELDLVAAVWILASNDENHLMTFEGIRERLGLTHHYDVRGLVQKRRELFRPGASSSELEQWKMHMRAGRRLPRWLKQIQDPAVKRQAIDNLTGNDLFRSQFRALRGAPVSSIQIVEWGLNHLDRMRKAKIASREVTAKSWQMWLVFGVGVANIIVSVVLALSQSL